MLKFTKAIAANTDLSAAQAFIFPSHQDGTGLIVASSGENAFLITKQQVSQLEPQFYNFEVSTSERLQLLYNSLLQSLSDLGDLQILLFAWHQDVLYLLGNGRVSSYIYRDGQLIDLDSVAISGQVISGYIQPADEIIFTTQSLIDQLDLRQQRLIDLQYLLIQDAADLQTKLDHLLKTAQRLRPVAVVVLSNPIAEVPVVANTRPTPVSAEVANPTVEPATRLPYLIPDNSQPLPKVDKPKRQFSLPRIKLNRFFWKLTFWRPKRWQLILVAILLISLTGAVLVKYDKLPKFGNNTNQGLIIQINNEVEQARQQLEQPDQAKQHLATAQQLFDRLAKQSPQEPELNNLRQNIVFAQADITKTYTVTDWPIYLTVSLVKSGFSVERLSVSVGQLLLLDKNQKSMVVVNVQDKTNTILAGPLQMGNAFLSSINGDYAYSYSVDKGVVQVDTANQANSQIISPDADWGRIQDLVAFASNVYLLDVGRHQVWKYVPIETGYSEAIPYFTADQTIADVKMMAIDSSVWLLRENNTISRFTAGSPDFFSVGGLDTPIQDIPSFFVSDKTEYIYILDPNNSRVVVLAKNGQFQSLYTGDKFKDAQDLIVDEPNKMMYVLIQNVIYQVPLR